VQRVILSMILLTAAVWAPAQQNRQADLRVPATAQPAAQITEPALPVTYSDLYCAGFVAPQALPHDHFIAAGLGTPVQSQYSQGSLIYLRGEGYTPGSRFSIVRELQDPNRYTPFPTGKQLLEKAGQLYAELGYATIVEKRGTDIAVAQIEFSCESIVPGDLLVPFTPKPALSYRRNSTMDRFPAGHGKLSARIMASRNFDQFPGSGSKVYINAGASSGAKAGDYFRIVRNYEDASLDPTDLQVFEQPGGEDTQQKPPKLAHNQLRDLPPRAIGEAVVLNTQANTATAMITFALEEIQIGDTVELEEDQAR
jgi:hypothetical protein